MSAAQRLVQQGMQQGMQTRNLEIAKGMLSKGLDRQLIGEMTGLSEEAIRKLQKQ